MQANQTPNTAPASQPTAGTAKPAIQVQIRQDQDAAFLRGEVVSEFAVVELDISALTPDQRAQLLKHKGYDGVFKIGDKMDQPTAEKLTSLLQSKADSIKLAEQEQAARELINAKKYTETVDAEIAKLSEKRLSSISGSPLRICAAVAGCYEVMAYPLYSTQNLKIGSIWVPTPLCKDAKEIMVAAETKLEEVKALLQSENDDIEKAEAEKAKAFYANKEAERKAAEEQETLRKKAEAEKANAERLASGKYRHNFGEYNSRRYGRPWGATVSFVGGRLEYDFSGGNFANGDVIISCKPGDIVACGQKDNRGSGTENYLFVMEEDGSMRKIERGEARELLANPIPKGFLAQPEEFADA